MPDRITSARPSAAIFPPFAAGCYELSYGDWVSEPPPVEPEALPGTARNYTTIVVDRLGGSNGLGIRMPMSPPRKP